MRPRESANQKEWCVYKASTPLKYWFDDRNSELIEEGLEMWEAYHKSRELNLKNAPLTKQGYRDIIYKPCITEEWHEANDQARLMD